MRNAIETSAMSAPAAASLKLRGDMPPRRPGSAIFRQVPQQLTDVGERLERHDGGNDERTL